MGLLCNTGIRLAKAGYRSNYHVGIWAENVIKSIYIKNGWCVAQSPGSRGVADLICVKDNKSHYVQCKSSTVSNNPTISNEEIDRLKLVATKNNATAIIAKIGADGNINVQYAKTNTEVII